MCGEDEPTTATARTNDRRCGGCERPWHRSKGPKSSPPEVVDVRAWPPSDGARRRRPRPNCTTCGDAAALDAEMLQGECYASLREDAWKPTLDNLHSGLASRSGGTSAAASGFRGGIVGTTFWEQVLSAVEHEQSRLPKMDVDVDDDVVAGGGQRPTFDDSKLYQRMLTDFVSSRSSSTGKGGGGGTSDPAREAAKRLGRALRKRSGADVDLSSLWGENAAPDGGGKRKKSENTPPPPP